MRYNRLPVTGRAALPAAQARSGGLSAFFGTCLLACLSLILAGCFGGSDEVTVNLNIAQLIPADWTPVGDFWEINIDDDSLQEYLLLYTYDNGQMGAVIYDPQLEGDFLGLAEPPSGENPPSSLLVPYRILPSYWTNSGQGVDTTPGAGVGPGASTPRLMMGQGFIAAPGATGITPSAVQRAASGQADTGQTPPAETPAPGGTPENTFDELLLQGDGNHMTFAWWRNAQAGYGVTQIYAPGGLTIASRVDGAAENGAVETVSGLFPYHDRSLLCREFIFTRTPSNTAPEQSYRPDIVFTPADQGIIFCRTPVPPYPFYPEGVVLAFIKDPSANAALATPEVGQQLQTLLANLPSPIVDDLQTVASLPMFESYASTAGQPVMTTVCAAVADSGGEAMRLLFSVEHLPPTLSGPGAATSDRMRIIDVADITAESQTTTCAQLVMQPPPGAP